MSSNEAGAVVHVYRMLGDPLPGQNVTVSVAASAVGDGIAAVAAAAGGNYVGARAFVERPGASVLAVSMTLCSDSGTSPDAPMLAKGSTAFRSFVVDAPLP